MGVSINSEIGKPCQDTIALRHEGDEVYEDDSNLPLGAETRLSFKLFMRFMVNLTALCSEALKCHPIEKLDSLSTLPAASASSSCFVNSHGVQDGSDRPGVVHYRKPNGVQPDLFVSVADSGPSACRAVSEIPDEIDQPAVGVIRTGRVEQNTFSANGRVAGEPTAGNGRRVFNPDDEFSRIGLTGAIQNRQSHNVFSRLLVVPLGLNAMNGGDILIRKFPGVIKDCGVVIGE